MTTLGEEDFKIIYKIVEEIGKKVLKCVFDTIYKHPDSQSDYGKLTLKQWFQRKNISGKTLRSREYNLDKNMVLIDEDPVNKMFPIKTYLILIMKANENMFKKYFTNDFKESLEIIKTIREKSGHTDNQYFENSPNYKTVGQFVNSFKNTCNKLLSDSESVVGLDCYTHDLKKNFPKEIKKITDGRSFEGSLKRFVDEGVAEICNPKLSVYKLCNTSCLFTDLLNCEKEHQNIFDELFINPHMTDNGKVIKTGDLLSELDKYSSMIIHGAAGNGKSTLSYRIFDNWCQLKKPESGSAQAKSLSFARKDFDAFTFVLLLPLRLYKETDKLNNILHETIFVKSCKSCFKGNKDLSDVFSECKILFILDGFDENSESRLVDDVVTLSKKYKKHRIILTTRGDLLSKAEAKLDLGDVKKIHLKGFEEHQRVEYVDALLIKVESWKSFTQNEVKEKGELFKTFLEPKENLLDDQVNNPLNINLMFLLWFQPGSDITFLRTIDTSTKLFAAITKMLKDRIEIKLQLQSSSIDPILEKFYFSTSKQLLATDFSLNVSGRTLNCISNYSRSILGDSFEGLKEFAGKFLSGLTISIADLPKSNSSKVTPYSYFHKTQMEYMAAEHMARSEAIDKLVSELLEHEDQGRFVEILPFIVGALASKNQLQKETDNVLRIKPYQGNFHLLWKVLSETKSDDHNLNESSCSLKFCTALANELPTMLNLNMDNILPALKILIHCNVKELENLNVNLSIDMDCVSEEKIKTLLSKLSKVLPVRHRKRPIEVELNLMRHSEGKGGQSDDFLTYLNGWSFLKHFSGSITTSKGLNLLSNHSKLTKLKLHVVDFKIYNEFINSCYLSKLTNLTKITFNFSAFNDIKKFGKLKIRENIKVNLKLLDVQMQNLQKTLQFLKQIHHENCYIDKVTYTRSQIKPTERNILNIIRSLATIVNNEVAIEYNGTNCPENVKEVLKREKNISLRLRWNNDFI